MRLEAMTVGLLRRAITIFQEEAYPEGGAQEAPLQGTDDAPASEALGGFLDDTITTGDASVRRFVLRLGNARYPFMKLVVQEHLVEGEFFFEVDTHDQMFELGGPEAQQFEDVRRYNRMVKEAVEERWAAADIPTAAHLKGLMETRPAPRTGANGKRILVVDDDECIASTLALLLEARGYEVTCLRDGRDAVEQADPDRHDCILMDNEMIHLNGFEACRVLKSRDRTRSIPVLIATAGSLTLQQLDAADGFLVKPFRMELLFSMLDHLLHRKEAL